MSDPTFARPDLRQPASNPKLEQFAKRFEAPVAEAYRANGFGHIDGSYPALRPSEGGFFQSEDGQVLAYRRRAWQGPVGFALFGLAFLCCYLALSRRIEVLPLLVPLLFMGIGAIAYQDLVLVLNAGRSEIQWVRRGAFHRDRRTVPLHEWSGVEVRAMPSSAGQGPSRRTELVFRTEALPLDRGFVSGSNWDAEAKVLRAWRARHVQGQ